MISNQKSIEISSKFHPGHLPLPGEARARPGQRLGKSEELGRRGSGDPGAGREGPEGLGGNISICWISIGYLSSIFHISMKVFILYIYIYLFIYVYIYIFIFIYLYMYIFIYIYLFIYLMLVL